MVVGGDVGKVGRKYRPTSKAGDAIGENSVLIVKTPSNLRSGNGATTLHEMLVATLKEAACQHPTSAMNSCRSP